MNRLMNAMSIVISMIEIEMQSINHSILMPAPPGGRPPPGVGRTTVSLSVSDRL
jgi:hypothetical protein